ncbi:hypothetical protein FPANT_6670 [Fusarium pseudoanthophilum]|uniref:Chromo domain-containing protein n=1 Tax=Fusarium pseudoanthophilum TaxID=48495 RepID=A0A8H5L8I0_9HYPO|nr:hypothetical protein FPANT_6670 [Fusarium pseudoanthophilum]
MSKKVIEPYLSLMATPEEECMLTPPQRVNFRSQIKVAEDYDDLIFIGAYDIQIESHIENKKTSDVSFRIKFKFGPTDTWSRGWAEEIDLHKYYQDIVLNYWRSIGGRCEATGFKMYKILRIIAEEKNKYRVQWVGYNAEEDTNLEPKKKVWSIAPKAVLAWKTRAVE